MLSMRGLLHDKANAQAGCASIIDIATQVGCSEHTVRRYLKYPDPPARKTRHKIAVHGPISTRAWRKMSGMARSSSQKLKRWVTPVGVPCCAIIVDENLAIIVETLQITNMMKNITRLMLSRVLTGNGNAGKVTYLVNPYQWFTSPKPASVAVRECWRWHFISASGRALNMVLT